MTLNFTTILLMIVSFGLAKSAIGNWEGCGGRLERALDALRRDPVRRTRVEDDEPESGIIYQRELRSAPLEMTVSRISVKLPDESRDRASPWAQVERCVYEPENNSLQTRLVFNDLTVSGRVSLLPLDYRAPIPSETCRMTLRLRRAGIDFFTSPIARGRGQMRIRTESSFLEPRFASIYAYGCRPTRGDKQIKRQDKWPTQKPAAENQDIPEIIKPVILANPTDDYEAAEPRKASTSAKEEDVILDNETRRTRALFKTDSRPGIWRKSDWVTRSSPERRRREIEDITPKDFALALAKKSRSLIPEEAISPAISDSLLKSASEIQLNETHVDDHKVHTNVLQNTETKSNYKRETTETPMIEDPQRPRELLLEEDVEHYNLASEDYEARGWQAREGVTREMEDVFLRGASQALTSYIERQLHPAIKETLMLSMGYTISYG